MVFEDKAAAVEAVASATPSNGTLSPLFLYLAFQGVHSGNNVLLQAPKYYLDLEDVQAISPDNVCGQFEVTSQCISSDPGNGTAARRSAAGMVRALDESVGDVVRALRSV